MTALELEVVELKKRVARLESTVRRLTGKTQPASPAPGEPLDREELLTWLKAEGLIREPTPEEQRLGAEWEALPEEEKQAILWELDHLPPGPMVSDIIIENRR
ncbi:MAG: hypothetical protein ACRDGG_12520 [Anaerolineae bacterium]